MNLTQIKSELNFNLQYFAGRQNEIKELETIHKSRDEWRYKSVFVTGSHRIGKTLFCIKFADTCLKDKPKKLYYVDFQRAIRLSEKSLWQVAAHELELPNLSVKENIESWERFSEIAKGITKLTSDCIIIFDEIESFLDFIEPQQFIHLLRVLSLPQYFVHVKSESDLPTVIIITRQDWQDLEWGIVKDSPLITQCSKLVIGKLSDEDTSTLVRYHFHNTTKEMKKMKKMTDLVVRLSGGHPYIVNQLLPLIKNGGDVEPSFESISEELLSLCNGYFRSIWQGLTQPEQFSVASIILGQLSLKKVSSGEHKKELSQFRGTQQLIKRGIIEDSNSATFSPLFSWWVASNAPELLTTIKEQKEKGVDIEKTKNVFETINTAALTFNSFSAFLSAIGIIHP